MTRRSLLNKALCMLVAVAGMALGLSSCGDDEEITPNTVKYSVVADPATVADPDELAEVLAAFNEAIGNTGGKVRAYSQSLDEQVKAACEAVWKRYADVVKSSYIKIGLHKRSYGGAGESFNLLLLGFYEMGQSLRQPSIK